MLLIALAAPAMLNVNQAKVQEETPVRMVEERAATAPIAVGRVKTNGGNLNVRSSASTSSSIVGKLANNTYLEVYSKSSNWYYVGISSTKKGYVSSSYVSIVSENIKSVTASALNIRSSGSTSASKLGQLSKGSKVGVISTTGGWSRIVYSGSKTGYVSSQYLSGGNTSTSQTYPAVTLKVVSFKQFDSRWGDLKLPGSSTTFRKSGCTTTALAMSESYRQGKTITPLQYSKTVKYTSGGAIYWPSNYKVDTSSSNYLTKIYNLLKADKAPVIGLKTSSGSQHYVTVTGYKGGNTLTASNFTINDPGSSSRTVLSQVLSTHPNFYKLISAK